MTELRPIVLAALLATPAAAQMHGHGHAAPADTAASMPAMHGHDTMAGMDMGSMHMEMHGFYGPYAMSREASGTSWQPEHAPHEGLHAMKGAWMFMLHGFADLVADKQGGKRGDDKVFADDMVMGMAQRPLGPGTLGLRTMLSLEPATIGKEGYPLLLQTGETADGVRPLVDRQHPHDLFMELAGSWSVAFGDRSVFVYGGLPGEPALGPPAFMHRFSGVNIPVAPITHHWLDSTHITFGVVTGGVVLGRVKAEASAFRGREPDQDRWDIERPKLDSHSFRLTVNPGERWSLQASWGRIASPEALEPDVDQERTTVSLTHDRPFGDTGHAQATVAWGRNRNSPGHRLDAFLAEAAAEWAERHTVFARAERVRKDELFAEPDPRAGTPYDIGELTVGAREDFLRRGHFALGIGAAGTASFVPESIRGAYGDHPLSGLAFLHAALR